MILPRCLLLPLMLLAAPAKAVPPPAAMAAPSGDIVVTARSRQMLVDFVKDMGDPGRKGQLARWQNEVCAGIIGLERSQSELVNGRISALARSLGLGAGGEGCRPTLLIIFTDDPGGFASNLARQFPVTLRSEGQRQLNRFAHVAAPVRWIAKSDLIGGTLPNSRLTLATRAELQLMLIVVDSKRLGGFSLGELADYLAVVGLAHPRFPAPSSRASILAMFDRPRGTGERFTMTGYDEAYLQGLYKANEHIGAAGQEHAIVSSMERDLGKPDEK